MYTSMVVSVSDSNNDWNRSDEKREDRHNKDSIRLDRLSLEQGKITDIRGSITSLNFVIQGDDDDSKDDEDDPVCSSLPPSPLISIRSRSPDSSVTRRHSRGREVVGVKDVVRVKEAVGVKVRTIVGDHHLLPPLPLQGDVVEVEDKVVVSSPTSLATPGKTQKR